MKARTYRPGAFTIVAMAAGLGAIMFLKLRRNGWDVAGWMDVGLYLVMVAGVSMIASCCRASIRLDDERMEIAGLLSRRSYPLSEITDVNTAKGADVKFKVREGGWVALPFWVGADGWAVAAAIRARLKGKARSAPAGEPAAAAGARAEA